MKNRLGFDFEFQSNNLEADDYWSNQEWSIFYDVSSVPLIGDIIDFDFIFTHITHGEESIDTAHKYKRFLDDYMSVTFKVISRVYRPIDVTDEKENKIGLWCSYNLIIEPIKKIAGDKSIEQYYNSVKNRLNYLKSR